MVSRILDFMALYPNTIKAWGVGIGSILLGTSALVIAFKVAL